MFIQMGLTWVMGWELSVVVVEPPLHPVFFPAHTTPVAIPSMAACKLKPSLYHLIHSSITHMLTLCPFCNGGRATPPSDAACHIGAVEGSMSRSLNVHPNGTDLGHGQGIFCSGGGATPPPCTPCHMFHICGSPICGSL